MRSQHEILRLIEDVAWQSDRAFFEQQPTRCFRIRPAWDFEIEDIALHQGAKSYPIPPQGQCWWIVVRQARPGMRGRYPFLAPHTLPCEASEKDARRQWFLLDTSEINEMLDAAGRVYDEAGGAK